MQMWMMGGAEGGARAIRGLVQVVQELTLCSSLKVWLGPEDRSPGLKGSEGYLGEEGIAVSQEFFSVPFILKNTPTI